MQFIEEKKDAIFIQEFPAIATFLIQPSQAREDFIHSKFQIMNKNISVLISIHFRIPRKNIIDCLNSLINQSLRPSEIIIVKDGVLNFSLEKICDSMDFDNFKIITLDINNGLANALNEGLKHCSFDLVARMDSDDICHPNRLEKQAYFMEINPEVVVSSGAVDEYDENMESLIFTKKVLLRILIY